MKKYILLILKELSPNILVRLIRYLKNIGKKKSSDKFIAEEYKRISEDISTLIEKYNIKTFGESIIIGNGPSLMHTLNDHVAFFENKSTFCVNDFVKSEYFEKIKPTFYVLADPNYWSKNISQTLIDRNQDFYIHLKTKTNWPLFLLMPASAQDYNSFVNLPFENSNITLAYYNGKYVHENEQDKFELYKHNRAIVPFQTVTVAALFLSLNLGFKTNYLVGTDMSIHESIIVDEDNVLYIRDEHFYDNSKPKERPFWKDNENTITWRMDEIFQAFSLMFKGFIELEEYSKFLGAKIYNASKRSFIDAFERYKIKK